MKREYDYKKGKFRHIQTKEYTITKIALNFCDISELKIKHLMPKRCGITGRKVTEDDTIALLFTDKGNIRALNEEAQKFAKCANIEFIDWEKER